MMEDEGSKRRAKVLGLESSLPWSCHSHKHAPDQLLSLSGSVPQFRRVTGMFGTAKPKEF